MNSTVAALLREAGGAPRLDAELLLCHCLGRDRSVLYSGPERVVAADVAKRFRALLARRLRGEPLAYLTGEREFWSLPLRVSAATLVPRADTETLVQWALELPLGDDALVLDAGTGSGAIALALAAERPGWTLVAADRSAAAVALARDNAARLAVGNVSFLVGDWLSAFAGGHFDLVVANPPYLAVGDPHLAGAELRHEPPQALIAGATGLEALAALIAAAPSCLAAGGRLLLEHGCDQGPAVRAGLRDAGFSAVRGRRDLAGHERVSGGRRSAQ